MCGLSNPERSIMEHWPKYKEAFIKLMKKDISKYPRRLLIQAIIHYFIIWAPKQRKYISIFCRLLVETEVYEKVFFAAWHNGNIKLDKNNILYDKKATA